MDIVYLAQGGFGRVYRGKWRGHLVRAPEAAGLLLWRGVGVGMCVCMSAYECVVRVCGVGVVGGVGAHPMLWCGVWCAVEVCGWLVCCGVCEA